MIKVMICDDQLIACEGLQAILSTEPGITVVGVTNNGKQALENLPKLKPDLVLMDLKMPILNGVQATRQITEDFPHIKVLALTTFDGDDWLFDALRAGAAGYLLKDSPKEEIIAAIRGTVVGHTYLDPKIAGKVVEQATKTAPSSGLNITESLNESEKRILACLGRGLNNHRIAEELSLSEGTIRNYISGILAKLQLNDRTQAALYALRHGIGHGTEF